MASTPDPVLAGPVVHSRLEDGHRLPLLAWRFGTATTTASTAPCGGGLGERGWAINAMVPHDYARHDQQVHGAELAAVAGLERQPGDGVVMLTAADVRRVRYAEDAGVRVWATVGLTRPTWAADVDGAVSVGPGTINILAVMPVRLSPAAHLNALCTATEAKAQALFDAAVPGTGTASDAVTIAASPRGPEERFAGPRSVWGARLARAVHAAVLAGTGDAPACARRVDAP